MREVFRINSPNIVSETIDGEVVIVNLEKGYYYSLFNTAVDIWSRIEQGMAKDSIIKDIKCNYNCSAVNVDDAVNSFLERLQAEDLVIVDKIESTQDKNLELSQLSDSLDNKQFENPKIEKFTDMEELLLLDPIHEVDETIGWPNVQEQVEI